MGKVLIFGRVASVDTLQERIAKLHSSAHGPFDVAFVAGIEDAAALANGPAFPLPVFVVAPAGATGDAAALSEKKVHLLAGAGLESAAGLQVGYIGAGAEATDPGVAALLRAAGAGPGAPACDLLLTTACPAGALNGLLAGSVPPAIADAITAGAAAHGGSAGATAARVAAAVCPRYHVSSGAGVFYQRAPYRNPRNGIVTRLIALGDVTAEAAAAPRPDTKFVHALQLTPAAQVDAATLCEVPAGGVTPCPYASMGGAAAAALAGIAGTKRPAPAGLGEHAGNAPLEKRARQEEGAGAAAEHSRSAGLLGSAPLQPGASGSLTPAQIAALEAEGARAEARGAQVFWRLPRQQQQQRTGSGGGGGGYDRAGAGSDGGQPGGGLLGRRPAPSGEGGAAAAPAAPPPQCWFCLASPSVEKHLIVAIGNEAYLALPKGGVSTDHALIVPIQHTGALLSPATPEALAAEVKTFLGALARMYLAEGKGGMVAFERVLHARRGDLPQHTHLQVVSLPPEAAARAESTFVTEGAFRSMPFNKLGEGTTPAQAVAPPAPSDGPDTTEYLHVQVWSDLAAGLPGPTPPPKAADPVAPPAADLVHVIPPGSRHPVQFGREMLCRLLNAPDKLSWKACALGTEGETAATEAFRGRFTAWDFTADL